MQGNQKDNTRHFGVSFSGGVSSAFAFTTNKGFPASTKPTTPPSWRVPLKLKARKGTAALHPADSRRTRRCPRLRLSATWRGAFHLKVYRPDNLRMRSVGDSDSVYRFPVIDSHQNKHRKNVVLIKMEVKGKPQGKTHLLRGFPSRKPPVGWFFLGSFPHSLLSTSKKRGG